MSLAERLSVPDVRTRGRGGSQAGRSPRHSPYPHTSELPSEGNWRHDKFAEVNDLPTGGGKLASRISSGTAGGEGGGGAKLFQKALGSGGGSAVPRSNGGGRVASGGSLSIKGASAPASTTLEIQELVAGTSAEDVKMIFSECGAITDAWSIPSGNSETTTIRVKFADRAGMSKAINQFDQQQADGRTLSVKEVVAPSVKSVIRDVEMNGGEEPETPKGKMYSDSIEGGVTIVRPPKIEKADERRPRGGAGGADAGHWRGRGRGRGGRGRGMQID